MAAEQDRQRRLRARRPLPARVLLLLGAPALVTAVLLWLPMPRLEAFLDDPAGTQITDRFGTYLGVMPAAGGAFQLREGRQGIPAACRQVFVELEDARFYRHPGVDPLALARAVVDQLRSPEARSGASTITMQLARLVQPRGRRLVDKAVEAWMALRIELRLTKEQILTEYLDAVPFGRNTRGVGAAAWTYFGTDLDRLSRAQLLLLGIIPRNPTLYDPDTNPDRLLSVAEALDRGRKLGIPPRELATALGSARVAHPSRPAGDAPHFVRLVQGMIGEGRLRGPDGRRRPAGGVLRTTLDLPLNHDIQTRVRFVLDRYQDARVTNAAVVAVDNTTDAVVGWVGSRDFTDAAHSGQIDGALIRRQSASTLKPFLYARAIEKGWTAATLVPDLPVIFGAADEEAYRPQNFDKRSHGVVRLRTALASSLNVPAVYTLSRVGLPDFLKTLGALGFSLPSDAAARYGLGTAIGNAEVTLEDLVHAFSVFPRGGTLEDLAFTERTSPDPAFARRVFDPFTAWMICSILSDPSARATGFGTRTYFRTSVPSLFKSGTSSEFTNLWCVGATPRYTVGAWAGNFDGRAVIDKTGSIVPTQVVSDVLEELSTEHPLPPADREFRQPAGVVSARVCTVTGLRATPFCDSTRVEYFRSSAEVPPPCDFHASPFHASDLLVDSLLLPRESVRILFPVNGQVFYLDQTLREGAQDIPVSIAARDATGVVVRVDGRRVPAGPGLSGIRIPLVRGAHEVTVTGPSGADRASIVIR